MCLRSRPDWHLDAAGGYTFEAYLAEQSIRPDAVDPIPVGLFPDYADWFTAAKGIGVREGFVNSLAKANGGFEAALRRGGRVRADAVVAAGYPVLREPP